MSYEVENFENQVIGRSWEVPVLVDFWAPWCGPCRTLGPVLERMAPQAGGRWELIKVNMEEHPELATTFNIASIPAVKLFVNGEVKDGFVGALPEREIQGFLDKALPSPGAAVVAEARRLLSEGAAHEAARLLEPLLTSEPTNTEARVLLAQSLLGVEPARIPNLLDRISPDSECFDQAGAIRTLARLVHAAKEPALLPEARVRATYLKGAAAVAGGDYGAALEAFIKVLELNRQYDNQGAKSACKAIFQLLGTRHPLVEGFHRAFSSALHA